LQGGSTKAETERQQHDSYDLNSFFFQQKRLKIPFFSFFFPRTQTALKSGQKAAKKHNVVTKMLE